MLNFLKNRRPICLSGSKGPWNRPFLAPIGIEGLERVLSTFIGERMKKTALPSGFLVGACLAKATGKNEEEGGCRQMDASLNGFSLLAVSCNLWVSRHHFVLISNSVTLETSCKLPHQINWYSSPSTGGLLLLMFRVYIYKYLYRIQSLRAGRFRKLFWVAGFDHTITIHASLSVRMAWAANTGRFAGSLGWFATAT